jgi:hypothetical protein
MIDEHLFIVQINQQYKDSFTAQQCIEHIDNKLKQWNMKKILVCRMKQGKVGQDIALHVFLY